MTRAALTRLTWTVSASAAVVLVVGGAAGAHRVLRTPCAGSYPRCENVQLSPEGLQLLTAGGVSPATYATLALAIHLGAALVTFALAALMMWRRPTDPLAVTAAFTWLALGVTVAIGLDVLARDHAGVAVAVAVAWFVQGAALVPLMCLFPDGRFVPRFSRWVALAAVLYHLWIALRPQGAQERWQTVDSVVHLTEFAVVIAVQVYRYRADSGTVQRQQTRWVVYGLGVLASIMTVVGLIGLVGDTSTRPGTPGRGLLAAQRLVQQVLLTSMADTA